MQQHKYPKEPNSGGRFACVICGAVQHPQMTATCFDRPTPSGVLMPEPARREYASEAYGAIGARVAELLKERKEVEAATAPTEKPVETSEEYMYC